MYPTETGLTRHLAVLGDDGSSQHSQDGSSDQRPANIRRPSRFRVHIMVGWVDFLVGVNGELVGLGTGQYRSFLRIESNDFGRILVSASTRRSSRTLPFR